MAILGAEMDVNPRGPPRCLAPDHSIFRFAIMVTHGRQTVIVFSSLRLRCTMSFILLLQLICTFLYRTLPLPLLPWFPSAFPLFSSIVPSTPSLTTPVSGDRAPIRDSRPRHSRGHEACLSPPYVIHSLLPLTATPSRDLHVTGLAIDPSMCLPFTCALWYRPP